MDSKKGEGIRLPRYNMKYTPARGDSRSRQLTWHNNHLKGMLNILTAKQL